MNAMRISCGLLLGVFLLLGSPVASFPAGAQDRPFTILLTNDDGIEAPGLDALVKAFQGSATIVVAAPRDNQSGVSHALTYRDPIFVSERSQPDGSRWYEIQATPATSVRLALLTLLDSKPDLVISGINKGVNLGLQTWFSGTVAAAREAALRGVPAIAVSSGGREVKDYEAGAAIIRKLVEDLRARGRLQAGLLLNINIPKGAVPGRTAVRVTTLSRALDEETYERRMSPNGRVYFWNTWRPVTTDEQGTDVHAYGQGAVTVTPLALDQTDVSALRIWSDLLAPQGRAP